MKLFLLINLFLLIYLYSFLLYWSKNIMQLFVNHAIAHSYMFSKFLINSCKSLEKAEMLKLVRTLLVAFSTAFEK